jgi:transposase
MKFAGIDIASEKHFVAVVDEASAVLVKSTSFTEDSSGYDKLFKLLGTPEDVTLVAMEATGHYWKNLFAALTAKGFKVALINPLRTNRFAAEDMQRTKTDAIDALGIARFAAQKRPVATRLAESATEELRELVRLRDRLVQDLGDRVRELHRVVDLGFPEFTRYVRSLDSELATAILKDYPTAQAFIGVRPKALSNLKYDGRHFVGLELANQLLAAARTSVGHHHGEAYRIQVKYFCQDIDTFRQRIRALDRDIESTLDKHEVGKLLTTIDGIGTGTAARLIAVLGNPADFRDERALASYVGVVPALKQSGKRTAERGALSNYGNADLRTALSMPTLTAVRKNPWLKRFYDRLVLAGKPPKVALIAAMRKLLHAIYSVAKHRRAFVPQLEAST